MHLRQSVWQAIALAQKPGKLHNILIKYFLPHGVKAFSTDTFVLALQVLKKNSIFFFFLRVHYCILYFVVDTLTNLF